jgi:hypothetical protein
VKLDPTLEYVTCQFCGTSSFVETRKRPVTQYVQQQALPVIKVAHVAALGSGCASVAGIIGAILGVVGAAVGVGVAIWTSQTDVASSVLPTPPKVGAPNNGAAAPADAATPAGPLVEEDYFSDATKAKARFDARLGPPIMAKSLSLMQYYATLEAQDRKTPDHVDSYKLWANKVEKPQPVSLGADKARLAQILFSLDAVDFKMVSKVVKQALSELKIEDGKVQVVVLERDSQGAHLPIWRVIVNGSRDNGVAEFSVTGEKLRLIQ